MRVTAPSAGLNDAIATVEALSAHDITLRRERLGLGRTDTLQIVPLGSVWSLKVSRRHGHAGTGALIGFWVGATGGVIAFALEPPCPAGALFCFRPSPIAGALVGLPSAGIGALVGALVQTDEWLPMSLYHFRVGLVPLPAGRLGLGASLAF